MREPINISKHFASLRAFNELCRKDRTITAAAQLIYRLLIDECNRSRWTDGFTCRIEDIEAITGLARQTIVDARMRLKSKGLIDFTGKPSRYTIYCLVDNEVDNSGTPRPPELKLENKTKEKNEQKRKGERRNDADPDDSGDNRRDFGDTTLSEAAKAEVEQRLRELSLRLNSH